MKSRIAKKSGHLFSIFQKKLLRGTEQANRANFEQQGRATWARQRGWERAARTGSAARHAGLSAELGQTGSSGLTRHGAELLVSCSRPESRTRVDGTTANQWVGDGRQPGQDGPNARTKLCNEELPVQRDQGLGTSIRQRADRPLERPAGGAGCSRVGWTAATTHDTWLTSRGTPPPATRAPHDVRRWVDR